MATAPLTPRDRTLRFLAVGLWNTAFGYLAFLGFLWLTRRLDLHYLFALLPTHVVAVANAYVCQRLFVFHDGDTGAGSVLRFLGVYGVTFLLNLGLLPLLVDGVGLPPWLAQGVALGTIAVVSYVGNYFVTFRVHRRAAPSEEPR
ncbi:MAG: GtrA family protein [Alphaproteobacteria bacterium]|nr:GtrA family protein [Alphaproteobacteria bacterium]